MRPIDLQGTFAATQVAAASLTGRCNARSLSDLDVFGARILNVDAVPLQNYTSVVPEAQGATPAGIWSGLNVCNITVTYAHPGRNDEINVNAWLPLNDWNGRFLASGGGGWLTGLPSDSHGPIAAQGFATASTDGGHSIWESSSAGWALNSPGNVDLNMLQNFASVALNDLATIGKQVTEKFYGRPADKSYWGGCSTGGRQGLMVAQRYPEAFDGILALAPAINWPKFIVAEMWAQHVMNRLDYYPAPEELNAITALAMASCDELDGVKDGIISLPGQCSFDAQTVVGKKYRDLDGAKRTISADAAKIANEAWKGPNSEGGKYKWYGLSHDTPLTNGLVNTECGNSSASSCVSSPFTIAEEWLKLFIVKDPTVDLTRLTDEEYFDLFHKSVQEYDSIIGTSDPDLSPFRRSGGKMITWHGTSDPLIFINGTSDYYRRVLELDPDAADFYRYFEAPGVGHCYGGRGPYPGDALEALIRWVEDGKVPKTLNARSSSQEGKIERRICPWPKEQKYIGGDPNLPASFTCV
ncbi:Putative tannase/feruloyl esterase, alpha/Beta hydrolase [Septoria linicola]|uniref:Carboxylic ester hydrolase n=1 Tax=Septoria linicola TaxID=215465 RepID=A0A9Q9EH35_9PEZI|nr:putative tannase/feruloyl esterase, alpha/Beta hydrolase [Septoria linicola]USW48903.1 Putative tannase/feruloyl esterase, alpha/Beta hydrolase [Septoria linicola]